MRKTVLGLAVVFSLSVSAAFAHGGHAHKAMGTVTSINATQIVIKDTKGQPVTVPLAPNTMYMKGSAMAKASDVKPGMRVVIEMGNDGKAQHVRMGTAASLKAKK